MPSNNKEIFLGAGLVGDAPLVRNMPVPPPANIIGSYTTEINRPPDGEVMKLAVTKFGDAQPDESEQNSPPPLFGAHIREGIAVVKDWMKKP